MHRARQCKGFATHHSDAFKAYETALEVAPEDLAAIEGLASLAVRTSRSDPRLHGWLDQIALGATEPQWASWAHAHVLRAGDE
jgi:hypothetical protein